MDDSSCSWRHLAESVNVGHDVVSALLFFSGRDIELFGRQILGC